MEATLIAIIGLTISIVTLFLSQLNPPKIKAQIGHKIRPYYTDFDSGESFVIMIPIVFTNAGSKNGLITNSAITIQKIDSQEIYYMEWSYFLILDPKENQWVRNEGAYTISIPGNSSISKVTMFGWYPYNQDKVTITEGYYYLTLYLSNSQSKKPFWSTKYKIFINRNTAEKLEQSRKDKKDIPVEVNVEQNISNNKIYTPNEVVQILGEVTEQYKE